MREVDATNGDAEDVMADAAMLLLPPGELAKMA